MPVGVAAKAQVRRQSDMTTALTGEAVCFPPEFERRHRAEGENELPCTVITKKPVCTAIVGKIDEMRGALAL